MQLRRSIERAMVGAPSLLATGMALCQGQAYSLPPGGLAMGSASSPIPVAQVSTSCNHTAVLGRDGTVLCFGDNSGGQCTVPSTLAAATQVSAGWGHTLALRRDGLVVAWGSNSDGQSTVPAALAVGAPAGSTPATQVAAGGYFSTALLATGQVVAWGSDSDGQRTGAATLSQIKQISCGLAHLLALRQDGTVRAVGSNMGDDCCTGYTAQSEVPVGLQGVTEVAAGAWHSLALRSTGAVVAWGSNGPPGCKGCYPGGQATVPAELEGQIAVKIAAGARHSLALLQSGSVVAWGSDGVPVTTPVGTGWDFTLQTTVPSGLGSVVAIAAGYAHSIAVRGDGTLVGWGGNASGQCNAPGAPATLTQVAAGRAHAAGITPTGTVVAWGSNMDDKFWANAPAYQAVVPSDLGTVSAIACGSNHTVALRTDGTVRCWGSNQLPTVQYPASSSRGQSSTPAGLTGVVAIGAGGYHSIACRSNGTVVCWGAGTTNAGEVATNAGDFGQSIVPTGLSGVVEVAGGSFHTLARKSDGTVVAWGAGKTNGGSTSLYQGQSLPFASLTGVVKIAAGATHSLALKSNGRVVGWGSNAGGECLGNQAGGLYAAITGTPTGQEVIIDGAVLTGVTDISAGSFSAALLSSGAVRTWGPGYWRRSNGYTRGDDVRKLSGVTDLACQSGGTNFLLTVLNAASSTCGTTGGSGSPLLASSGGLWRDLRTWNWAYGLFSSLSTAPRLPGTTTTVNLGTYGSVASDCAAAAGTFTVGSGGTLILTAEALVAGNDHSVRATTTASIAGRVWLLGGAGASSTLPLDLNVPILSAATVTGNFELLQTEVPPPPGKFATIVPETVGGRTVFSLRLLPLPLSGELTAGATGTFTGKAVAAETIDINHDGFDDLALAVDFGASQPGLVQILLNDGLGALGGTSVLTAVPAQPTCLAVGDVDGDGKRDVVVGIASDQSARVYRDNGTGGLAASTVMSMPGETPTAVVVIPPSGASAMAAAASVGVGTSGSKLKIFLNGSLQQELVMAGPVSAIRGGTVVTGGTRGRDIATGGTRSSSVGALLPVSETGFMQVVTVQTTGLFAIAQSRYLTANPVSLDMADLDDDGLDDIVTTNANPVQPGGGAALPVLSIFRNTAGTFGGGVPYQPAGASSGLSVSLIDVDNDGDRDIVSVYKRAGSDSEAALLRVDTLGAGTPISIGQTTVLDASDPILSARGNLDGIGGEDLFLVNQPSGSFFAGVQEVKPYLATGGLKQGDLDGDGVVGPSDVSILLLDYGPCPGCASDLDGNGEVDGGDLSFLLLLFE